MTFSSLSPSLSEPSPSAVAGSPLAWGASSSWAWDDSDSSGYTYSAAPAKGSEGKGKGSKGGEFKGSWGGETGGQAKSGDRRGRKGSGDAALDVAGKGRSKGAELAFGGSLGDVGIPPVFGRIWPPSARTAGARGSTARARATKWLRKNIKY